MKAQCWIGMCLIFLSCPPLCPGSLSPAGLITPLGCGFLPPLWHDLMASLSTITSPGPHIRFFLLFISQRTDVFTWGGCCEKKKSIYNMKQIQWRATDQGANTAPHPPPRHGKGDRLTAIYECTYRSFRVFYSPLVSLCRRNCVQVPGVGGLVCLISAIKGKLVPLVVHDWRGHCAQLELLGATEVFFL